MKDFYLIICLRVSLPVLAEHHCAEVLEGDHPAAVIKPVDNVVNLNLAAMKTFVGFHKIQGEGFDLCRVDAGAAHG